MGGNAWEHLLKRAELTHDELAIVRVVVAHLGVPVSSVDGGVWPSVLRARISREVTERAKEEFGEIQDYPDDDFVEPEDHHVVLAGLFALAHPYDARAREIFEKYSEELRGRQLEMIFALIERNRRAVDSAGSGETWCQFQGWLDCLEEAETKRDLKQLLGLRITDDKCWIRPNPGLFRLRAIELET